MVYRKYLYQWIKFGSAYKEMKFKVGWWDNE